MNDMVGRLAAVVVVLILARVVALILARFLRPVHPDVVVGDDGDRPGVVLFSSTDCTTCKRAIERIKESGFPFREITHELEPQRFESWGITGVPLTVILDSASDVVDLIPGVPSLRRIHRAARTAGLERVPE